MSARAAVALALVLAACASLRDQTAVPPEVNVTGTWQGWWAQSGFGGPVVLTLQQTDAAVSGTMMAGGALGGPLTGSLTGAVSGRVFGFISGTASGQVVVTGNEMMGTITGVPGLTQLRAVRVR